MKHLTTYILSIQCIHMYMYMYTVHIIVSPHRGNKYLYVLLSVLLIPEGRSQVLWSGCSCPNPIYFNKSHQLLQSYINSLEHTLCYNKE